MNTMTGVLDLTSVQFMGKVVAAFSHDFKNALAIINENAGLLKDLTALAAGGRPTDAARLEKLAERIAQQVQRADEMTRQVNQFAHSADNTAVEIDLHEMLVLAAALSRRPAALQRITLEIVPATAPLRLTVFVFGLQHLLYECLQAAMAACGAGGRVTLCATGATEARKVDITPIGSADAGAKQVTCPLSAAGLATGLGARLETGASGLSIVFERLSPATTG